MEYLVFFAVLFLFLVIYIVRNVMEEKKRERRFEESLRTEYGKREPKTYPDGRLASIRSYYDRGAKEAFCLDDTTANDLDFEGVFRRIDRCYSAAGEEALYRMLRIPCFDEDVLLERKRLITYFDTHEDDRVKLQKYFARVGKTGKYSVYEYLDNVMALPEKSNAIHYLLWVLIAISVGLMFVNMSAGLLMFLGCICFNFVTYMKEKERIQPYLTTFGYFLRILDAARQLCAFEVEGIRQQTDAIRERLHAFDGFSRFAFFVTGQSAMSQGPEDLVMEYLRMALHLNIVKFNSMLKTVQTHEQDLTFLMESLGQIEAMISAGEFAASLPYYCWGTRAGKEGERLHTEEIFHPMLKEPVSNGVTLTTPMLLTGSNASGKSTFLKTVAVAQILTQSIGVVPAKEYVSGFSRVFTSMALRDDLDSGRSYFIVEIEALKRIMDAVEGDYPVMCFVDEVLRGTNTVERIAASAHILSELEKRGVFVFAATHDIELTRLLEEAYANYHFEETIQGDDISFSYLLQTGRAKSRNAIRLLGMLGFEESIIENATARAEHFVSEGEWA